MATPLKRRQDSYAYAYPQEQKIIRGKFKKQRVKAKKKNPFKVLTSLIFLGLIGYYVMPYMFLNYLEPMFLNRIKNKDVRYSVEYIIHPTRKYLSNSFMFDKHLITPTTGSKMSQIATTGEDIILKSQLENLAKQYPQLKPHIFVWDYTSGKSVEIDSDKAVPSASIIKIPILLELFYQIQNGKMDINDSTVLREIHRTSGSGSLQYGNMNKKTSLNFLADKMITESDNSATNALLEEIGGKDALNRSFRYWGMKNSHIGNWLPDLEGQNKMSARDVATMIYNFDNPNFLNSRSKEYIKEYMGNVKNRNLIQAGLPEGAILYHKTGDIGKMLGDAGVIYSENGKKIIVAILVERPHNNYGAKEFIQKATKLIYGKMK